jgi:hypothetical protein
MIARLAAAAVVAAALVTTPVSAVEPDATPTAVATSAYTAVTPCRLLDSRLMGDAIPSGGAIALDVAGVCGVPASATAVAVTLTVADTTAPGFLTAYPADLTRPGVSNLNWTSSGETRANGAITSLSADGALALYVMSATHVIVDVTGAFIPAAEATSGRFTSVQPQRLVDTRTTRAPLGAAETIQVERPPDVPVDAVAIAVNVTITDTTHPTFVTGFAHGEKPPEASLLNADGAGQTRAASAIVPINSEGFDLFNLRGGHLIVDVAGFFTGSSAPSDTSGLFVAATPERLVDTRLEAGGSIIAGGAITLTPPKAASGSIVAAVVNVTIDRNAAPGFVTLWPANTERPEVSSVNAAVPSTTVANLAIVSSSVNGFNVFASAATEAIVDLAGWFVGPYVPADPDAFPVSNVPAAPDPLDLPGCAATGRSAVVDKAAQRFWLCENGAAITDRRRMTSASASYGLPAIGSYKVFDRDAIGYGRNGEQLHRFVTFYTTVRGNRIGFHQYVNQDPGTIGELNQRGSSDGCLRVGTDDSWTVWNFLRIGDRVIVITN